MAWVCDSCIDALYDNGFPLDEDEVIEMAIEFGGDISDHLCDVTEGYVDRCDCGCRRHRGQED